MITEDQETRAVCHAYVLSCAYEEACIAAWRIGAFEQRQLKEKAEKIVEKVHNAWMDEKIMQGFHSPSECPSLGGCEKCHPNICAYVELPDNIKKLDEVTAVTVLMSC